MRDEENGCLIIFLLGLVFAIISVGICVEPKDTNRPKVRQEQQEVRQEQQEVRQEQINTPSLVETYIMFKMLGF